MVVVTTAGVSTFLVGQHKGHANNDFGYQHLSSERKLVLNFSCTRYINHTVF